MWAKIITFKRTKDLNYFSLCAFNLCNTRVSQFELNYWNKLTFPRHTNLLICTCTHIYIYIHSPATLLGTPVQLLGNTNCKSANHMAATHAFKRGMVVGARRAGLSISKTADLPGFSRTTISRVYRECSKKRKYPVSGSCVDENA